MDKTNITLLIAKNELVVNDRTVLPDNFGGDNNEYVAIEFLTHADSNVALGLKICSPSECSETRLVLEKDGLYYYHKLYVPNVGFFETKENIVGEVFTHNDKLYQVVNVPIDTKTSDNIIDASKEITPAQAYEAAVKA